MTIGFNARQIKLVACVSMMFSHIGFIFWLESPWWQIVGRIAFPLFAFMIANGAKHSGNVRKYLARLLIFAVLIQYPYSIFLANGYLNICFTLSLGLAAIVAWQSNLHLPARLVAVLTARLPANLAAVLVSSLPARLAAVLASCLAAEWLHAEYGWYGILMIFTAYIFYEDWRKIAIFWSLLNLPLLWDMLSGLIEHNPYPVQGLCLLAIPFVILYNGQRGGGSRWEFYAFYIGHLALLYGLRLLLLGH